MDPGTRSEIIDSDWCLTPAVHGGPNVLWLSGLLGSGQSTISTTIASDFGNYTVSAHSSSLLGMIPHSGRCQNSGSSTFNL